MLESIRSNINNTKQKIDNSRNKISEHQTRLDGLTQKKISYINNLNILSNELSIAQTNNINAIKARDGINKSNYQYQVYNDTSYYNTKKVCNGHNEYAENNIFTKNYNVKMLEAMNGYIRITHHDNDGNCDNYTTQNEQVSSGYYSTAIKPQYDTDMSNANSKILQSEKVLTEKAKKLSEEKAKDQEKILTKQINVIQQSIDQLKVEIKTDQSSLEELKNQEKEQQDILRNKANDNKKVENVISDVKDFTTLNELDNLPTNVLNKGSQSHYTNSTIDQNEKFEEIDNDVVGEIGDIGNINL